jgi:glycosyltransferase involved in cell wall biosynthesis
MSSDGIETFVIVEPYFTRIGHNVEYSSNIFMGARGRVQVQFVISSDASTRDAVGKLVASHPEIIEKSHDFILDGSPTKRFSMFLDAILAVIGRIHDKNNKILVLLACEPFIVMFLRPFLGFRRILLVDHSCMYPDRFEWDLKYAYKFLSKYFVRRLARDRRIYFVVHSKFHRGCLASVIPGRETSIFRIEYGCTVFPWTGRSIETNCERIILLPGIWRREKGIHFFLEHFPAGLLLSRYRVVIAGHPQEFLAAELTDIARRRNIAEKIDIIDQYLDSDSLRALYARATFVVLPYLSSYSGGAGPLKDACGHGCPVLVSNAAGLGRVVNDHRIGITYRASDPVDFVRAVLRMDETIEKGGWRLFAENAHRYAEDISWPRFAQKLVSFGLDPADGVKGSTCL